MAESRPAANGDSQRVVAALADLFDQIPPNDGLSAQQELSDHGIDPEHTAARIANLAARQLRPDTSGTTAPVGRRPQATEPHHGRWWIAAAALAACLLAAVLVARDNAADPFVRLAHSATPRPIAPPPRGAEQAGRNALGNEPSDGALAAGQGSSADRGAEATESAPAVAAADTEIAALPGGETAPVAETHAFDQPGGAIIDASNWQTARNLLPEPVLRRVRSGDYWYEVVPIDDTAFRANYPPWFWEQSRDNAGRYDIDAATCGLVDAESGGVAAHLEGFPFPTIQPSVADAACRIAWNMRAADMLAGASTSSLSIDGFDRDGITSRLRITSREGYFLGQATDNPENLRQARMIDLHEPVIDDVAGLSKRTNDWTTPDKVWTYAPNTRRVRRVPPEKRSEPIADLPLFAEDLGGFAGKIESYQWTLVGEATVFAAVASAPPLPLRPNGEELTVDGPAVRSAAETPGSDGVTWRIVDGARVSPRPVWIIEARSPSPYYNFAKVVLYVDKEMYRVYWKLVYDRGGQYFYNAMFGYYWARDDDEQVAAVLPSYVLGVDDVRERAALARNAPEQTINPRPRPDIFTLRTLTTMSD